MITHKELLERLYYDKDTGVFTWVDAGPRHKRLNESEASPNSYDKDGYKFLKINGRSYRRSRLAWFYVYGIWPKVVDHIDHNITNDAIENLRDVSYAENSQNQVAAHKDSSHGYFGVRYNAIKKRWQARIQINGKRISLGGFNTPQEAHDEYLTAKRELHRTCTI